MANVKSILDEYITVIGDLKGNWEGQSYNHLSQVAEDFVGEYQVIDTQIEKLNEAVELYKKYQDLKNKLNDAENKLAEVESQTCKTDADRISQAQQASQIRSDIADIKKDIENLKQQIKNALEAASKPKLEANSLKGFDKLSTINGVTSAGDKVNSSPSSKGSKATINSAIDWANMIADDDTYGYSQDANLRWGNDYYDCSSFVISAYEAAGVKVKEAGATYTGNMKDAFEEAGFTWIPGNPNVNDLKPGDILLNVSEHTEMYIGNGKNIGAHCSNFNGGGRAAEISVSGYYDHPWDGVLRYTGK